MFSFGKKIPVKVHPIFLLLSALIAWMNSLSMSGGNLVLSMIIWMIVIFYSVLFHEYGHALTAQAFGQKARIDLAGLGGLTHRHGKHLKLWKEFLIVLNGPLFGIFLALAAYFINQFVPENRTVLKFMLSITFGANLFWTVLNLLPVVPLDGGRLLSIILESIFGVHGIKIAAFLGIIFSALIGITFFLLHAILAGALFMMLTFENFRAWQQLKGMTEQDKDDNLRKALKNVEHGNSPSEQKIQEFEKIRQESKKGILYEKATHSQAMLLVEKGEFDKAYDLLSSISKHLSAQDLTFLQQLAFKCQRYSDAIKWGTEAYQEIPDYTIAVLNAFSYAQMQQVIPAIGWLETGIRQGLPDPDIILGQKEFDPIRKDPLFQELKNKF